MESGIDLFVVINSHTEELVGLALTYVAAQQNSFPWATRIEHWKSPGDTKTTGTFLTNF